MAVPDDTALKALINSNIPDANPGLPRRSTAAFVRATLFTLIDWVKSSISTNLTTWLRISDGQPGGANTDDVYRVGKVVVGTTADDGSGAKLIVAGKFNVNAGTFHKIKVNNSDSLYPIDYINEPGAAQLGFAANWVGGLSDLGFVNTNLASQAISFWRMTGANAKKMLLMLRDGAVGIGTNNPTEALHVEGNTYINGILKFPTLLGLRKIALYGGNANDHQFLGFGVDAGTLRYQIGATTDKHVFSAGTSPATSAELMRIQGDGKVGIGHPSPSYRLEVAEDNPTWGVVAQFTNTHAGGVGMTGSKIRIHQGGVSIWEIGQPAQLDAFVINGWGGGSFPERLRIDINGFLGIGTSSPTSMIHVKGTTGHQQFRLETDYTPTSSSDPNGLPGQICADANYIYKKSAAGWKRSPIFATF